MSSAYDRKPLPEADPVAAVRILVYLAVGLSIRSLLQRQIEWGSTLGFQRPSLEWSILWLALTVPAGILVHEGGHYLAGISLGQVCRRFVLGPLEVARRDGRWMAGWIPIRRAGMVDLVPRTFSRFRLRRAVCVAGGPIASMASGLIFVALSQRAHTVSLFWIWSYCAQWSLVGLMGLLPMRRGAARSDGYLLWELIRGGAAVDELQRNLLVASSHATPLRMREWPRDLIRRLAGTGYDAYLGYLYFLDGGKPQEAGRSLECLMAGWTRADPPEYALESAYFLAVHGNDPAAARQWLASESRDAETWVRLRAQAAVEWASGRPEDARRTIDEALSQLQSATTCGAYEYEIDRLHELRRLMIETNDQRGRTGDL